MFLDARAPPRRAGAADRRTAAYPRRRRWRGWRPTRQQIIARYPQSRSALLPLLHLVQSEDGYLTPAGIAFCAAQLGLTDAEVTAVATFYSMYRRTPTGDYLVGVCTNTLCAIMGGDAILESLEDHLGVHAGRDHRRRPDHPRARRVQRGLRLRAGGDGQLGVLRQPDPSSARDLVDALRAGEPVTATRGAPVCTFRETARTLAGLPDLPAGGRPPMVDRSTGAATLAGLRVAQERDMTAPASPARVDNRGTQPEAVESTRTSPRRHRRPRAPKPATETDPSATDRTMTADPVLSRFWDEPQPWSLDTYRRHDGYQALHQGAGDGSRRRHRDW